MQKWQKERNYKKIELSENKEQCIIFIDGAEIEVSKEVLDCAFNQAVRWELLETNPVSKATLPKFEKKVRDIWTMEDLTTSPRFLAKRQ